MAAQRSEDELRDLEWCKRVGFRCWPRAFKNSLARGARQLYMCAPAAGKCWHLAEQFQNNFADKYADVAEEIRAAGPKA